ncbi:MAG TPA: tetratricopeptide repeat protein [Terriglobales bacterium]|nr:tetratricopeptide repeat protein [Terriglobales bacterium]
MRRFSGIARKPYSAAFGWVAVWAGIFCGPAQSQSAEPSAVVQGAVRDSEHHAIAAASVHLAAGNRPLTVYTDSGGMYRFAGLGEGSYRLRAEKKGYGAASFGPFTLAPRQAKRVDLVLGPAATGAASSAAALPEFFDDPQFQVAGVAQATSAGVHGSDEVRRSNQTLARETASLRGSGPGPSPTASSERSLRAEVERTPDSAEANYRLGRLLTDQGRGGEAVPFLEQASKLNPRDFEISYQLARAYAGAGELEQARTTARALAVEHDQAELHHLLGSVEEKLGNPLEAVRQYQKAAELEPSEPYFFDWGSEFLKHGAVKPATEVFAKGNTLFPDSPRMLIGLGVAWYARGAYEKAARSVLAASDLHPSDPAPYLFLGRMLNRETAQTPGWVERLERFARLNPGNAMANYYLALSLRKQAANAAGNWSQAESLFRKAVQLDPHLAAGYLQLGILYAERDDYGQAVPQFQKAIESGPTLEEPHYRLAQAYRRLGQDEKAREQIRLYKELSKQNTLAVERERHEIELFVFALEDGETREKP